MFFRFGSERFDGDQFLLMILMIEKYDVEIILLYAIIHMYTASKLKIILSYIVKTDQNFFQPFKQCII